MDLRYTPADATTWTVDEVLSWAKEIPGLNQHAHTLKREEVDGEVLLGLTFDELINKPYSLPGGPAKKIINATKQLRPSAPSPPLSPSHVSPSQVSSEAFSQLQKELDLVKKQLLFSEDDFWTVKSVSSSSSNSQSQKKRKNAQFRKNLIDYYGGEERCMVTGIAATGQELTAGHIWRASQDKNPALQRRFGLTTEDVESPRNGLLLLTTIEDAFDDKRLCFFYNFTKEEIQLHILDPSLVENKEEYAPGHQFSELEGKALNLNRQPLSKGPFRRLLASHCKGTYAHALKCKWITKNDFEKFKDFSHLSELAIENDENT